MGSSLCQGCFKVISWRTVVLLLMCLWKRTNPVICTDQGISAFQKHLYCCWTSSCFSQWMGARRTLTQDVAKAAFLPLQDFSTHREKPASTVFTILFLVRAPSVFSPELFWEAANHIISASASFHPNISKRLMFILIMGQLCLSYPGALLLFRFLLQTSLFILKSPLRQFSDCRQFLEIESKLWKLSQPRCKRSVAFLKSVLMTIPFRMYAATEPAGWIQRHPTNMFVNI